MSFKVDDVIDTLDEWAEARGVGKWTFNALGQAVPRRAFIENLVTIAAEDYAHGLSEEAYEQGIQDGSESGYEEGYDAGYDDGYSDGYTAAENNHEVA